MKSLREGCEKRLLERLLADDKIIKHSGCAFEEYIVDRQCGQWDWNCFEKASQECPDGITCLYFEKLLRWILVMTLQLRIIHYFSCQIIWNGSPKINTFQLSIRQNEDKDPKKTAGKNELNASKFEWFFLLITRYCAINEHRMIFETFITYWTRFDRGFRRIQINLSM